MRFVGKAREGRRGACSTSARNPIRTVTALQPGDVDGQVMVQMVEQARAAGLIPDEQIAMDGSLLAAGASPKSFQPKDKPVAPPSDPSNPTIDFTARGGPAKPTSSDGFGCTFSRGAATKMPR